MSRAIRRGLGLGSVALILAAQSVAAPAANASATPSYKGRWYEATAGTCTQVPVSSRWSVTLKKDGTASISLTIFMDGALHAAWGGIRFDLPNLYPACDGYVLGTLASVPSP